jgi:hypothetical protein
MRSHLQNKQSKMEWRCGSSSKVSALQSQSPEFKPQSHQKKKRWLLSMCWGPGARMLGSCYQQFGLWAFFYTVVQAKSSYSLPNQTWFVFNFSKHSNVRSLKPKCICFLQLFLIQIVITSLAENYCCSAGTGSQTFIPQRRD